MPATMPRFLPVLNRAAWDSHALQALVLLPSLALSKSIPLGAGSGNHVAPKQQQT